MVDSNYVNIRNGTSVLAKYGAEAVIGDVNGYNLLIDSTSLNLRYKTNNVAVLNSSYFYSGNISADSITSTGPISAGPLSASFIHSDGDMSN